MGIVTCAHLAQAVREKAGLTRTAALGLVGLLFEEMEARLAAGEEVKVYGFDSFVVRDKAARPGRNPRTLEEAAVTVRRVAFKSPRLLKKRVAEGQRGGGDSCRE